MNAYPTRLERQGLDRITIEWSDGQLLDYLVRDLRDRCPCATCREKRSQPQPMLPVLTAEETQPLSIAGMKPVGSYAYGITFSDGHDSGIFTFELLREIGSPSAGAGEAP